MLKASNLVAHYSELLSVLFYSPSKQPAVHRSTARSVRYRVRRSAALRFGVVISTARQPGSDSYHCRPVRSSRGVAANDDHRAASPSVSAPAAPSSAPSSSPLSSEPGRTGPMTPATVISRCRRCQMMAVFCHHQNRSSLEQSRGRVGRRMTRVGRALGSDRCAAVGTVDSFK